MRETIVAIFKLYLLLLTFTLLVGCDSSEKRIRDSLMPNAQGEPDEIILVIDSTQWIDSLGVGSVVRGIFHEPIRGLPQDEPYFKIIKVNPLKLNYVLKSALNIIFVMTLDNKSKQSREIQKYFTNRSLNKIDEDSSLFMSIRQNEFAKGQNVVFFFSSNKQVLIQKLLKNKRKIQLFFEKHTKKTIEKKIFKSKEKSLMDDVLKYHNVSLSIPKSWNHVKRTKNFEWLRKIDRNVDLSIFFYYEPYQDSSIFNNIDALRDSITTKYLTDSEKKEIHIKRQEIIKTFTERVNLNNQFAIKARSLWKLNDNSRGGPYVSYTFVNDGILYYIEGYVDAPGEKKKKLIRELDIILSSFKIKDEMKE